MVYILSIHLLSLNCYKAANKVPAHLLFLVGVGERSQEVPSKMGMAMHRRATANQLSLLNIPRQLTESTRSSNMQEIPRSPSTEDPSPQINHVPSVEFGSVTWLPHHIN